jgi:predicted phage tail protein
MKTLVLHGALAAEFGSTFKMNVAGISQAIRLMDCNTRGRFSKALYGKYYEFRWGSRVLQLEDEVAYPTGADELHIEPIVEGNIKGLFGLFAGIPVVGAAFAPLGVPLFGGAAGAAGLGALGGFGAIFKGILLLGVLYLVSSALQPDAPDDKEADQRNSFLFDGAVNTTSQGGPVPLVYGYIRTGSVLVQGGIEIEDLSD